MSEPEAELVLVAAVARNRVIGANGGLPWSLPEDMKHFRAVTNGHAIVMGRKTHESIGRALPNRRNIVVTRDAHVRYPGCETAPDLDAAIALARTTDAAPRIIGGGLLYAAALPLATELWLTEIDRDVEGDTHFPPFSREEFEIVEERAGETPDIRFVRYRRRADVTTDAARNV